MSMYLFALCKLFYISIVFRNGGFRFHLFLEVYFHEVECTGADLKQWNGKCISIKFLSWNLNYKVTPLIMNELYTFFIGNMFFQLSLSVA